MLQRKNLMASIVASYSMVCACCTLPVYAAPVIEQPTVSGLGAIFQNERAVAVLPVSQSSAALPGPIAQGNDAYLQTARPGASRDGGNIAIHLTGGAAIQTGNGNHAEMLQANTYDEALIVQSGNANTAIIRQSGAGVSATDANRAMIQQTGSNFTASITQTGMQNRGLIVQR
jgi:Curlin associated repeat